MSPLPSDQHVAVVVLNWNGWSDTIACVESVLHSTHRDLSIIICDNASQDDSVEHLRGWGRGLNARFSDFEFDDRTTTDDDYRITGRNLRGRVLLLQAGRNGGYAAGNNAGMRTALADPSVRAVWILNNDVVVERSALHEAYRVLHSDVRLGLVGSTLCYMNESGRVQCQGGGLFDSKRGLAETIGVGRLRSDLLPAMDVVARMDFVNGAAAMVSRTFLEDVGLMSERYFLYWEELDWARRAHGRYRLGYAPDALVLHKVGASIGTKDGAEGSEVSEYFYNRNRIRFCVRHSRRSLPYVYAQLSRDVLMALVGGRSRRALILGCAMLGMPRPRTE